MDFIFEDYEHFKYENDDLFNCFFEKDSNITYRFIHVYHILEYFFEKEKAGIDLSKDELVIFQTAYSYMYEQVNHLNILKEKYYNSFEEMEKNAKAINLLLYVYDFQKELEELKIEVKQLDDFADEVLLKIEKKEEINDEMFGLLDDIMFGKLDDNYVGVCEIFASIAEELGLMDVDEETLDVNSII